MKILLAFALLFPCAFGAADAADSAATHFHAPTARTSAAEPPGAVPSPSAPPGASVWQWPLAGSGGSPPEVSRPFTPPAERWLSGHRGVDLAAPGAARVLAAGPGTVTFAGTLFGRGVVVVSHGEVRTSYEPVLASVHPGDPVTSGAPLGTLGTLPAGHCPSDPCLHWGLLSGHGHAVRYYDPLLLLGLVRLRLEPVGHPPG